MNSTYTYKAEAELQNRKVLAPEHLSVEMPSDALEFATIDGGVVDYQACEEAVSNGAGIFIGGYFVGVTDVTQCYVQQPFMCY